MSSLAAPLVAGTVSMALTFPPRSGKIERWRGGILLALFVVYLTAVLQTGDGAHAHPP